VTRRHRRDFLLDSSGISALAASRDLLVAYLELLEQRFDGALLIPVQFSPRSAPVTGVPTRSSTA